MSTTDAPQTRSQDVLREAIVRNCGVVLSLPSAGMLRHHRSRFLAEAGPDLPVPRGELAHEGEGFWLESVAAERPLLDELVVSGKPVGVSFKGAGGKVIFTAPILRRDTAFRMNAETVVEAILMPMPTQVKSIQRRNNYRVAVPEDADLTVRLWHIRDRARLEEDPSGAREIGTKLRDISVGGLGVILTGKDGKPPKLTPDDRLRVELKHKEATLLLEANLRYPFPLPEAGAVRAGLQFANLEGNLDGRQKLAQLAKIVGRLHREEVRRARLGV
jgi:c-di-GMP-binding flagellar brake protein YcgR